MTHDNQTPLAKSNKAATGLSASTCYALSPELLETVKEWTPANRKPIHDLVNSALSVGIAETAKALCVHPGYVLSWMPRRLQNGKIDAGWEPSGGFISAALARIGYSA